jgi:hypothetical protein
MSFVHEKEGFWRKMVLALFALAMLGPWSFDLLHVPAQYPCGGVTVRLAGDFCGFPVTGFQGLIMVSFALLRILRGLVGGNVVLLPEFYSLIVLGLLFLPCIGTVLLILKERPLGFRTMNLIFWVLGALAAGLLLAMQTSRPQVAPVIYLVWGAWLYILVAVGAVALEWLGLRGNMANR